MMVVVIEVSDHSLSSPPHFSHGSDSTSCVQLYGSWNIRSGTVELIHSSALLPPPPLHSWCVNT